MPTPELLAPAGSFDALRAAAWAGANAVYLGGKSFNARASAANFSDDDLAKAIIFAHRSNVKVYVTVNTLLKDNEIEPAVGFLNDLYNMGADAVIIQDLGLLKLAAQYVPKLERHASTQTTTTSLAGVEALCSLGAQRVVLARELAVNEVREIVQAGILPVEIFVHGALCVAYSGQCLLSSLIGGRSGNRGQCAQPCRLPFKGQNQYPLSPKDLCLIEHVPELMSLGVSSWKIEGRLKRPEYVAEVVSIYRKAIDKASRGESVGIETTDITRLQQAFNRGFTSGYLFGRPGSDLYSGFRPDNRGIVVGKIAFHKQQLVKVVFSEPMSEGDVCDLGYPETSFMLNKSEALTGKAEVKLQQTQQLTVGAPVYRLVHAARNQDLAISIAQYEPSLCDIELRFSGQLGSCPSLQVCAEEVCVEAVGTKPLEATRNTIDPRPLIERQLHKLGGTPFRATAISVDISPEAYIAVGEVNTLRREAIDKIQNKLWGQAQIDQAPTLMPRITIKRSTGVCLLGATVKSVAEAQAAAQAGVDYLVYGHEWSEEPLERYAAAYEHIRRQSQLDILLRLPRIMHNSEEKEWRRVRPQNAQYLASSPGGILLAREASNTIYGDTGLNILNSYSTKVWPEVCGVTLSHELNRGEVLALAEHSNVELEMIVHGRQLLMVHGNCVWSPNCKGKESCTKSGILVDRKGAEFPVITDYACRSYILNSQVLSLLDVVPVLMRAGIGRVRLELAGAGAELVGRTVSLYRQAMSSGNNREHLAMLRSAVAEQWGILTRGHWQRGV